MYTGPNSSTTGLVLALDAANPKSYVSGSATWFDLSGNRNSGSLVNGAVFDSSKLGNIYFDGIDDYVNFNLINLSNVFTINIFAKPDRVSGTNTLICPTSNNVDNWISVTNSKMQLFATEFADVNNFVVDSVTTIGSFWYSFTATCNVNTASIYLNGNFENSTTVAFNIGSWSGANSSVGRRAAGGSNYFSGSIALVQAWNRVLSPSEILQNHNAIKSRFGL